MQRQVPPTGDMEEIQWWI